MILLCNKKKTKTKKIKHHCALYIFCYKEFLEAGYQLLYQFRAKKLVIQGIQGEFIFLNIFSNLFEQCLILSMLNTIKNQENAILKLRLQFKNIKKILKIRYVAWIKQQSLLIKTRLVLVRTQMNKKSSLQLNAALCYKRNKTKVTF